MLTPVEQLEAMRSVSANWDGYGADAPNASAIDLAKAFVRILGKVRRDADRYPGLSVTPTRVGGVMILWEDQDHEHELEVEPDGSVEFLHESKLTGQMETQKYHPDPNAVANPAFLMELFQLSAA